MENQTNTTVIDPESNLRNDNGKKQAQNPWKLLKSLNNQQRVTFVAAFLGWTLDAFDYFIVILTIPHIANEFNMEPSDIASR
jgi:SHS family lactate transporter-like MFS transporter